MRIPRTLFSLALFFVPVFAQQPSAASEQALRDQVTKFYQAHIDGKFRQAEACVCEQGKDAFYNSEKQSYNKLKIEQITYEKDGKEALVKVRLDFRVVQRAVPFDMIYEPETRWIAEGESWCMYFDTNPRRPRMTPFGMFGNPEAPPKPNEAKQEPPTPGQIATMTSRIAVSKNTISLNSSSPSKDELTITNEMPGHITLALASPDLKNLKFELSKSVLAPGEKATVTVTFTPSPDYRPADFGIEIIADPMAKRYRIAVKFSFPKQ